MVFMFIRMGLGTKVNGKTISNMDQAKRSGPTTLVTKVVIRKARSMVGACISGQTALVTMVSGTKIGLKATASISGKMDVHIPGHGKTIICTVKEFIHGLTAGDMKVSMKWTKSMDMAFTSG